MSNDEWGRDVRRGAAHAFGGRHYRWYAFARYRRTGAVLVGALVLITGVAGGGWWLWHHIPGPVACLAGAGAALIAAGLRLAYLLAHPRRRAHGSGGVGWLLLIAAALIAAAALLTTGGSP